MRYLSPFYLFGETLKPPFDKKAIQRERKKLLVELELNESDTLEIKGELFTKTEIIEYFEELQNDAVADYQTAVLEDPVLLSFLQDRNMEGYDLFCTSPLYDNRGFVNWISPYFYSAFVTFVTICFDQTDATAMRTILRNRLLMTEEDTERAWLYIVNILNRNISLFDDYMGKARKTSPQPLSIEKVIEYMGYGYIQVIQELPNSRFGGIKDTYAFSMLHPSIAFFNRNSSNRSVPISWLETAETLATTEDTKERIEKKLAELNGLVSRQKKKAPWSVVWIVIVCLRGLSLINFSGSSSTSIPANVPVYVVPANDSSFGKYKGTVPLDKAHIDSIMRSIRSTKS